MGCQINAKETQKININTTKEKEMKKIVLSSLLAIVLWGSTLAWAVNNYLDASGTVSTASTQALASNVSRQFLMIQNVSTNSNNLGVTLDGTVAAIGSAGTITLAAGQGVIFQQNVPSGAVNVIGSASSTVYTIKYL